MRAAPVGRGARAARVLHIGATGELDRHHPRRRNARWPAQRHPLARFQLGPGRAFDQPRYRPAQRPVDPPPRRIKRSLGRDQKGKLALGGAKRRKIDLGKGNGDRRCNVLLSPVAGSARLWHGPLRIKLGRAVANGQIAQRRTKTKARRAKRTGPIRAAGRI